MRPLARWPTLPARALGLLQPGRTKHYGFVCMSKPWWPWPEHPQCLWGLPDPCGSTPLVTRVQSAPTARCAVAPSPLALSSSSRPRAPGTPSLHPGPPSSCPYPGTISLDTCPHPHAPRLLFSCSAVLGSAEPLPTLAALLCPSSPCGQPAAAALELLQGFTRRANVDVDLKIYSPPPPQPPSRRVSPPPPPPPGTLARFHRRCHGAVAVAVALGLSLPLVSVLI